MKLRVAFATDDGKTFIARHFGDADYYHVYEIEGNEAKHISVIKNTPGEEDVHADPKKAKGITQLLKSEGVSVAVAKVFGPNIKRIKQLFVCIVTKENTIKSAVNNIIADKDRIEHEWEKGKEREHLVF